MRLDDVGLDEARVSVTKCSNPRAEIMGFCKKNGQTYRLHVFTLVRKSWGDSFASDARTLEKNINENHLTRNDCLKWRNDKNH